MDLILQGGNGNPQRPELFSNTYAGNVTKEPCSGMGPLSWLFDKSNSDNDKYEKEEGILPSNILCDK
jgi:hypothetical protein